MPASIAKTRPPAAAIDSRVCESHGGDVKSHILGGLGDFDDCHSPERTKFTGAANAQVGAFDRFHRDHGLVLDANALADVQAADRFGDLPTKVDVLLLLAREGLPAICPALH